MRFLSRSILLVALIALGAVSLASAAEMPSLRVLQAYDAWLAIDETAQAEAALRAGEELLRTAAREEISAEERARLVLNLAAQALRVGRTERALDLAMTVVDGPPVEDASFLVALDLAARAQEAQGNPRAAADLLYERLSVMADRLGHRSTALAGTLDRLITLLEAAGETRTAARLRERRKTLDDQPDVASRGKTSDTVVVPVHYGTNRSRTGETDPTAAFDAMPGPLSFGIARVSIPRSHRIGQLEAPSWWRLEFFGDPERHVLLRGIEHLERDEFIRRIRATLAEGGGRDGLLFIHGYNVSFADGARRAAQLSYDLEFEGPTFFYSWPSQGTLLGYSADADSVASGSPLLAEFMRLLSRDTQIERLHVVAHSMGNRYLLAALEASKPADLALGHVVLAAPDVSVEAFRRGVETAARLAARLTLYASSGDLALKLSAMVNGETRAGDVGAGPVVLPGLDTVDASLVEVDTLGHSYFGDSDLVLADLLGAINLGWMPPVRCSLVTATVEGRPYWRLKQDGCDPDQLRAAGRLLRKHGVSAALAEAEQALRSAFADADEASFWKTVIEIIRESTDGTAGPSANR